MAPTLAKLDFRSMKSIIASAIIEPKAPKINRSHDEIVEEMLKVKDFLALQKFVDQSDEKCLEDLNALIKEQNMKKWLVLKVLGTIRIRRVNQMRNSTLRLRIGAFYGNCLQNPRLYRELLAVQVPNKRLIFSKEQKKYLEEMYKIDTNPGQKKRIEMAQELNAMCSAVKRTHMSVYKWFKTRRDARGG